MNTAVADTSIISRIFKQKPEIALYEPLIDDASLVISFQTVAEMRYGTRKDGWGAERVAGLETFLTQFAVVEYSSALADGWARVMDEAQSTGRRLEAGDAWVAATALYLNVPLVAHDNDLSAEACPSITVYNYASVRP